MVLPIIGYGAIVLKTKAKEITVDYPELNKLILDMYETMYDASGVGLAAPQIGKSIRLFVIDTSPFDTDDFEQNSGFEVKSVKKTFINPVMIDESGENASFEEGCLSIPNIREHINRKSDITIKYQDENFTHHQETFSGILARVIQHEYDHLEGTLRVFNYKWHSYRFFIHKPFVKPSMLTYKKSLIRGVYNNCIVL